MPDSWTPGADTWAGHFGSAGDGGDPHGGPEQGYPPPPAAYPGDGYPDQPEGYSPDPAAYRGDQPGQWADGPYGGAGSPAALAGYRGGYGGGEGEGEGPPPRRRRRGLILAAAVAVAVLAAIAIMVLPGRSGSHVTASGQGRAPASAAATSSGSARARQQNNATPALTMAAAAQVLSAYVSANNQANQAFSAQQLSKIEGGPAYRMDADGYTFTLNAIKMGTGSSIPQLSYAHPAYYVPRLTGYPRWFVTSGTWTDVTGTPAHAAGYLLFTQASRGAPWMMVDEPNSTGASAPQIATTGGYAEAASPTSAGQLAVTPAVLPQDTASWLDGTHPAVLTLAGIGTLQDTHDQQFWQPKLPPGATDTLTHTAYPGDVYALATTGGGALVFYATADTLTLHPASAVEIPGYHTPGGPDTASVPYTDMFAAYDPPHGQAASIRVTAESSGI